MTDQVGAPRALPPRAEIAQLTLQVRAAEREADQLERRAGERADSAAAVLRDRLEALLAERRAAMAAEIAAAERDAAERLAAAQAQLAAEWSRPRPAPAPVRARPLEPRPTLLLTPAPEPEPVPLAGPEAVSVGAAPVGARPLEPRPALLLTPAPEPEPVSIGAPLAGPEVVSIGDAPAPLTPSVAAAGQLTLVVDPDSFARAVAAAVAAVLAERPEALAPRPATQWVQAAPIAVPAKRSFWSGLWHADVLLAVMAMAIILIILLAWSV